MIGPGATAPSLTALDQHGTLTSIDDLRGRWTVLWWYPKAMTPGCSSCGKAFQQAIYDFGRVDARIVGVSFDSPADNLAFAEKYGFGFPLLSATKEDAERWMTLRDPESEWADFPKRISYLIDPQGVIRQSYNVGDPSTHPAAVLVDLERFQTEDRPRGFLSRLLHR